MKGGLGGYLSLRRCCIYRSAQKKYSSLPSPLPLFPISPRLVDNAIRSNYSSSGASLSQSAPDSTQATHSSDRKVRTNSVQLLCSPSLHPLLFFTSLHVHHSVESSSSFTPAPRLPVSHLHSLLISHSALPHPHFVFLRDSFCGE